MIWGIILLPWRHCTIQVRSAAAKEYMEELKQKVVVIPKSENISAFDISVILNNALDNAIRAAKNYL